MTINAKLVAAGAVRTVTFQSTDPSDADLLQALGGKGDLVTAGWVAGWEVLKTSEDLDTALVLGAPPFVSAHPKRRTSCNLHDAKALALVKYLEAGYMFLDA